MRFILYLLHIAGARFFVYTIKAAAAKDSSNGLRIFLPAVLLSISQNSSVELSMHYRMLAAAVLFVLFTSEHVRAQNKAVAERLGYPPDAKLLIIHPADLSVAHSLHTPTSDP